MKNINFAINVSIKQRKAHRVQDLLRKYGLWLIVFVLGIISAISYVVYYNNGLGLAYNDARSHLDIGRRVVEGLKPGLAQLGSVWLPLPHILMIPTIWHDFFWHSGLSGAVISMISFVATGVLIYLFLEKLGVGWLGRIFGVLIFTANLNILYLTSTAMTELLLLATMTAGSYYLVLWAKDEKVLDLIKSAFFVMLSTLVRYDSWFLFIFVGALVIINTFRKKGYKVTEGTYILFASLAGIGVVAWFLWNYLIFNDPLYFIFGPFSAHTQQAQLSEAGNLPTKGNLFLSITVYLYALVYNSYALVVILGAIGAVSLWLNKKISSSVRIASLALIAPLIFNVLALFLGHSVLFIQGISGNTWFNVRYGMMLTPSIAIFTGCLIDRAKSLRWTLIGTLSFVLITAFINQDAVTLDDARVGSSQKNVTEVSGWLRENAAGKKGFILISVASHDAIIFSSGLPMKRFIHEGTGAYWESATAVPDHWARWIVMRTHDDNDLTFKLVKDSVGFDHYNLVDSYPFADIYELDFNYLDQLNTEPVFGKQK